jgi:hypothetical protein
VRRFPLSLATIAACASTLAAPGTAVAAQHHAAARAQTAAQASVDKLAVGWRRCTNTHHRFSIRFPRHWYTTQLRPADKCRQFDRTPFTVPPNSEYPITDLNAVSVPVSVTTYIRGATDPTFAVTLQRKDTRVCDRRAVLFETVATGEGLYEKGTRFYGYAVKRNGTAFVVFTITTPGDDQYASNKAVVDRSVRTLRLR